VVRLSIQKIHDDPPQGTEVDVTQMHDMAVCQDGGAFAAADKRRAHSQAGVLHGLVLAACTAALLGAFLLKPDEEGLSLFGFRWPFRCWLHDVMGIQCGLCGLSRSFCSLARGDFAGAVHFHRLGPVVFALFCLEVPYRLWAVAAGRRGIPTRWVRLHTRVVVVVCGAILVNWMVYLGGLLL